jgi:DNA-binding MarR family transcriptional regulator
VRKKPYERAGNLRQIVLAASRFINQDVTMALQTAGYADLKNSEVFCLAYIDLHGTSLVEIAERSNVSKQAASKLVAGLVARGYLSTSPAPSDARSVLVQFTTRGTELMRKSFALFEELERDYSMHVGEASYMTMKRVLRALGKPTG